MANRGDIDGLTPLLPLKPLRYHAEVVRHLQSHEADLWKWFSSDRIREKNNEAVRLDLLKATYRIERDANTLLYEAVDKVASALQLDVPITCYQSAGGSGLNASLAYTPGEAHIVFTGPILSTLTPTELQCLLSHELMHFALLDRWKDYLIASQLLAAMTNDANAQHAHLASARLMRLYTEVYCDRGAYKATGDMAATITTLVKVETATSDVSAESYLRQSDEIFAKGHPQTQGITHPENFIRARALKLWVEQPQVADEEIAKVIEGPMAVDSLDLLGQKKVAALTRRVIGEILRPKWMQTEPQMAHARLFFDDFAPAPDADEALAPDLKQAADSTRDYFCYVMLDFAAADRELEEAPLAAAILLADQLGFGERLRQLALKELNLRKKQLEALAADARSIVAKAQEQAT